MNLTKDFFTSSLLKNGNAFRSTHIPNDLLYRDDALKKISSTIKNKTNLFLFGKSGSGKTLLLKYIKSNIPISGEYGVFFHNGKTHKNQVSIYDTFIQSGKPPGAPTYYMHQKTLNKLNELGGTILLLLDDVNYFVDNVGDLPLQNLLRMNEELENATLCVISTSKDLTFLNKLELDTRNLLTYHEVYLKPYTPDELCDILQQRAQAVFNPGVVDDAIFHLCAAYGAKAGGSAGDAITFLRKGAEAADEEGSDILTEQHIYAGQAKAEEEGVAQRVHGLPPHGKILLTSIIHTTEAARDKITTTGATYREYENLCLKSNYAPLTQRRISSLISDIAHLELVTAYHAHKGRYGTTREIFVDGIKPHLLKALELDPVTSDLLHTNGGGVVG